MRTQSFKHLAIVAAFAVAASAFAPAVAGAQTKRTPAKKPAAAAADTSQKNVTRLGGPTRFSPPVKSVKALQTAVKRPRAQKDLSKVIDEAGLTGLTPQILKAMTEGNVTEVSIPVGTEMQWMALRRGGKPTIVRNLRWAGRKPFEAYQFAFKDEKGTEYTFLVPKDCGNLTLMKTEAPPPPPPPAQTTCGVTLSLEKVKGGNQLTVDGSGSLGGSSPATAMTFKVIGPDGQPVSFTEGGQAKTELTLKAPTFKTSVFVKKLLPGNYTVKTSTMAANEKAPAGVCEATVAYTKEDKMDWFLQPTFGKERTVQQTGEVNGSTIYGGFCDPLLGIKVGPSFKVSPNWRVAPTAGVAFNFDEFDRTGLFAELEANYWTNDEKTFFGTGVGVWHFNDGDAVAPSWLLHFGREVAPKWYFVVEGRLFLDQLDDIDNNYQFWGGVRYIFK